MIEKGAELPESLMDVKISKKFLEEFFIGGSKDTMQNILRAWNLDAKSAPGRKLDAVMAMYDLSPETGEFIL